MKFSGEGGGGKEETGGGSGLKSRGLFDVVIAVTALKTDLERTKSEDMSPTLATSITTPPHVLKMSSRSPATPTLTQQEEFLYCPS